MALWSRECPVCADIGWCNDHPIKDHDDMTTKPEPEALDLRPWGYAPGSYLFKCIDCPEKPTTEWPIGDKRSIRCEAHAREAMERAPAQPVADAGGVTEDDVIGLINIVTDLAGVDALDKAYPEVWGRLDAMVNHAVAAATAAKDADIVRLREALKWALPLAERAQDDHRMERIRCGHTDIVGQYKNGVSYVGIYQSEVDQIEEARAALSEAREAGAKD